MRKFQVVNIGYWYLKKSINMPNFNYTVIAVPRLFTLKTILHENLIVFCWSTEVSRSLRNKYVLLTVNNLPSKPKSE